MFDFIKNLFNSEEEKPSLPETREVEYNVVDLPTGIYVNGMGKTWWVEGTVFYGEEFLVIHRPYRSNDWMLTEASEFKEEFLDISPVHLTLVNVHHAY